MRKSKNLYQDSIKFIKDKQKSLLIVLIIPMLAVLASSILESLLKILPSTDTVFVAVLFVIILTVLFFIRIVHLLLSYASSFAVINFLDNQHQEKNISPVDSYKIGWQKFGIGVLLQFIQTLFIVFGLFLLVFPGIYLTLIFAFALYIYMLRNKGIKDSLAYSYYLIHNRVLEIFKKILYGLLQVFLPVLGLVLSIGIIIMSVLSFSDQQDIGFFVLGLFGVIGFIYFLINSVQKILALQDYNYAVFIEFEKTKEVPNEKDLVVYRKKLKKIFIIILAIHLLVLVSILSFIYFI